MHMKRPHSKVTLKVSRHGLLESVSELMIVGTWRDTAPKRAQHPSLPFSYSLIKFNLTLAEGTMTRRFDPVASELKLITCLGKGREAERNFAFGGIA